MAYDTYSTYGIEQIVAKEVAQVQQVGAPFLSILREKGRLASSTDATGTYLAIPVVYASPTVSVTGVAAADELTARSRAVTNGHTLAVYNWTHYVGAMNIRKSEKQLLNRPGLNLMDTKVKVLVNDFFDVASTDAATNTVESATKLLGLRYVTATGNTVGGIDQSSVTNWQSYTASGGAFAFSLIDNQVDRIACLNRTYAADLILASYGSTNVFGKIRSALTNLGVINDLQNNFNGGIDKIRYINADVVRDNKLGTAANGSMAVLSTGSWHWGSSGSGSPELTSDYPLPGTDAHEFQYTWFVGLGCSDPKANSLITSIS